MRALGFSFRSSGREEHTVDPAGYLGSIPSTMLKGSQASVTTTLLNSTSFSGLHGYLHTYMHQPPHKHIHCIHKKKFFIVNNFEIAMAFKCLYLQAYHILKDNLTIITFKILLYCWYFNFIFIIRFIYNSEQYFQIINKILQIFCL